MLYYLATGVTRAESILNMLGILVLFIIIVTAAYYVTKWVGKTAMVQQANSNISIVETFRIGQNKFIQIVKIGSKYVAVGISKDTMEKLAELQEEDLVLEPAEGKKNITAPDFRELLDKMKKKEKSKG